MKLCWIHPMGRNSALEPLWSTINDTLCGTLAQGTKLNFRFLDNSGFTRSLYAEHVQ